MLAELMLTAAAVFAPQSPSGVVINELCYDDSGTDDYEFVELYNGGAAAVDISGWMLIEEDGASTSGGTHTIMPGVILAPGAFYVIGMPAVPNVNETLAFTLENGPDGVYLADATGAFEDGVTWEMNRWSNPIPTWLEGDGLAGDIQLHENVGNFNSISRVLDGLDTDNNGCDFHPAPWTPGSLNVVGFTVNLPYVNNFDAISGSDVGTDFTWSFVPGNYQDPTAMFDPAISIPVSPQGGNVAVWHDPTGGGNANWLSNFATADYLLETYVYFTGANPLFDVDDGENWAIGVRGHSDSFGEYQDVGGFHAAVSCTTVQSGHTGIAWVCNRTATVCELFLVDFNDGQGATAGGDFIVLAGPIAIQTGVNDGWQRVRLAAQGTNVVANFGGTYGCDDGQRFTATTNTTCANGVYLTYRECVTINDDRVPLITDELTVTNFVSASSAPVGTGSPSSIGTPVIAASTNPVLGDATFAINASGLNPGGNPFAGIVLDLGQPLPGIQIPGAPAGALLYANPTVINLGFADGSGNATFALPLPCKPSAMGSIIVAQVFDWDAALPNAIPVGLSAGLSLTLGY